MFVGVRAIELRRRYGDKLTSNQMLRLKLRGVSFDCLLFLATGMTHKHSILCFCFVEKINEKV